MAYAVTMRTVYTVDHVDYTTRVEAMDRALLLEHWSSITQDGDLSLIEIMETNPEYLITKLQAYVEAKRANSSGRTMTSLTHPTNNDVITAVNNMIHTSLYAGGNNNIHTSAGKVFDYTDLAEFVDKYLRSNQKINAIKLVRICTGFGLLEAQNWVEDRNKTKKDDNQG